MTYFNTLQDINSKSNNLIATQTSLPTTSSGQVADIVNAWKSHLEKEVSSGILNLELQKIKLTLSGIVELLFSPTDSNNLGTFYAGFPLPQFVAHVFNVAALIEVLHTKKELEKEKARNDAELAFSRVQLNGRLHIYLHRNDSQYQILHELHNLLKRLFSQLVELNESLPLAANMHLRDRWKNYSKGHRINTIHSVRYQVQQIIKKTSRIWRHFYNSVSEPVGNHY